MRTLRIATTINARFDHVSPIEATRSDVTITHRCLVFAELLAVARSGLVDVVLIADDVEMVNLDTLQQLMFSTGRRPKLAVITDLLAQRQRLTQLGIPAISSSSSGPELVEWLQNLGDQYHEVPAPTERTAPVVLEPVQQPEEEVDEPAAEGHPTGFYNPQLDLPDGTSFWEMNTVDAMPIEIDEIQGLTEAEESASQEEPRVLEPTIYSPVEDDTAQQGQITVVWGPIGAPGVTTVAVNLAAESAILKQKVLLIDANTYGAAVAVHLGLLHDSAAIAQACRDAEHTGMDPAKLQKYVQPVSIESTSVDILTGLTRPERWPQLRGGAWELVLDAAREGWDHVIVDCGFSLEQDEELSFDIPAPQRNLTTIKAVEKADLVVAVGTGDPVGFVRFLKGYEQLQQTTTSQVIPVLNKVTALTSGVAPKHQLGGVWDRFGPKGKELQHFLPWSPEMAAASLLEAKTLVERAPKAQLRQALESLAAACAPQRIRPKNIIKRSRRAKQPTKRSLGSMVAQVKEKVRKNSTPRT